MALSALAALTAAVEPAIAALPTHSALQPTEAMMGGAAVFVQVLLIDLVLAGDNAVAVGLAAAGLAPGLRRKVIVWGVGAAVLMRVIFALVATKLLQAPGLVLLGGLLLLWIAYKLWRELAESANEPAQTVPGEPKINAPKGWGLAFRQILLADLSMSLDNVLGVAAAAREHPLIMAGGLVLSVTLMGLGASVIAGALHRHRWIGWAGLVVIVVVAGKMIWEGGLQVRPLVEPLIGPLIGT